VEDADDEHDVVEEDGEVQNEHDISRTPLPPLFPRDRKVASCRLEEASVGEEVSLGLLKFCGALVVFVGALVVVVVGVLLIAIVRALVVFLGGADVTRLLIVALSQ
jgi:hypothetical protein